MEESNRLCASTGSRLNGSLLPLQSECGIRCWLKVRKIGSKGAVLVIVWSFFVFSTAMVQSWLSYSTPVVLSEDLLLWTLTIPLAVIFLVSPIAGLLASTYFGRYKTLYSALWLMWVGSVVTVLFFILLWIFPPEGRYKEIPLWFCINAIADTAYFIGLALFLVTAVPFGLDQMTDASGDQIKTFIHWYSWSLIAGLVAVPLLVNTIAFCVVSGDTFFLDFALLNSFLNTVLLSATLSSNFLLRGWLTVEPEGSNPLKPFYGILKFAAKHKTPVRRSAFTYWEEEKPSRIDLAKSKYGGPFTNEQVEDVKTCLRMFAVIASCIVAVLAFSAVVTSVLMKLPFAFNNHASNYAICYSSLYFVGLFVCLVYSVVSEIIIHPLIERVFQSTMKKVGLSLTLPVTTSLLFLLSSAVWYINTTSNTCMFSSGSLLLPVNPLWIVVPGIVLSYSFLFLSHSSILEFICAQSPYILRGMLIGLMYSVCVVAFALGTGVYYLWSSAYQEKDPSSPGCGVWFYLFTTITVTLGCVLWCAVAKWYKRRERDEPEMCRIFAENYYSR